MTVRSARLLAGAVIAVASIALMTTGCGWGGDIGTGSRTDPEPDLEGEAGDTGLSGDVADRAPVTVERVIDGDSIELDVDDAVVELRLAGYNAPELYIEADGGGSDVQTCNGLEAREAVESMLDGGDSIELIESGEDRFGRTLGELIIDGEHLVDRLLLDGHGLATGDNLDRRRRMLDAASARVGIWGDSCGPPVFDRLRIGEVQVNPPGDDRDNLVEEYVQVVNLSSEQIDLDGWLIRDDTTGHRFGLPGSLGPGERLTVFTGGDRTDSDVGGLGTFYLGESFPVWSNDWETVILVDPNGVFADWRFVAEGRVLLQ